MKAGAWVGFWFILIFFKRTSGFWLGLKIEDKDESLTRDLNITNFSFFIFPLNFAKIYASEKNCKTIYLAPWGMAAGTYCRAPRR
jgi:hypothetical protein